MSHIVFSFISMSFSTIFPQKTPFPPTCAIFAPLAMASGNWRWSADYLKDIGVPHLPPYFFSMSFSLGFLLKNAISASFRHFDAVLTPFLRHFRWHLVLGADHWAGWRNWVRFQKKNMGFYIVMPIFLYIKGESSKKSQGGNNDAIWGAIAPKQEITYLGKSQNFWKMLLWCYRNQEMNFFFPHHC